MKKIFAIMAFLAFAATNAQAQFEEGTKYINASLSGLNLQYSTNERSRMNVEAAAGVFITDGLLIFANVGYEHQRHLDDLFAGANARYYFTQNGIYMGSGAQFVHYTKSRNDIVVPIEIGYAYYLNHYVTFEPAVYYKMSTHDFSNNSTVGLKIGFGYYF